ncbi:ABC transporter ATP-binding protein [uncultured Arthrobacter sp.]|uniref:ABC transporter ATP-binding protein n=1 Tax=uncultured Arthrobacter sp. TaxID=114050 RepID=UPI0026108BD3|nr:ABC transporter ATP-binding protein [uncultured Arthrobacter sp.]
MRSSSPAVEVSGLVKDFGPVSSLDGKKIRVLDGVSLCAEKGQVTALLGANGAGKTTTLECAQGLQKASAGSVRLLGEDPWRAGADLRSRVGIMLQEGGLPPAVRPVPLLRHVAGMFASPLKVDDLAGRLGIDSFARTSVRRLSGGQKQRLALACALVGDPEVLFLDEPSAGLDPQSRNIVFELISELRTEGMAIILTTHLLDDAQKLADYVYILDQGRTVRQGTVPELTAHAADATRELQFEARAGLTLPFARVPHLQLTERSPGHYGVSGALTPKDLAVLAAWWEEEGVLPASLSLTSRSLEDVFLDISGRGIR